MYFVCVCTLVVCFYVHLFILCCMCASFFKCMVCFRSRVCFEYLVTLCVSYLCISISACSSKMGIYMNVHPLSVLFLCCFHALCLFIRARRRCDTSRNCWSWQNNGYSRLWGRRRLCPRWRLNWPREWPRSPRQVLSPSSRQQQQKKMRESVHKIIFCQENALWDGDKVKKGGNWHEKITQQD